jgi:hypothetical protein
MTKNTPILTVLGAILLLLLSAVPSAAQATRTWVSGVGDDVNPCSRTAPCKTFPGAISKTAAGGEIDALDPGGFGAVTITKSITIAAEGTGEAGILVAGTNGMTVNAGPNDVVILRGLQIDGGPVGSNSLNGVKFNTGAVLEIQNCAIRNFTGSAPNGYGIFFAPSAASSLFVSDTVVTSNGVAAASSGGGIFIQPTGAGSAKATLVRVNVTNNRFGVRADGTASTGPVTVSLSDSAVTQNASAGLTTVTAGGFGTTTMEVIRSVAANNGGEGLKVSGAAATLRIGYSSVTGNATGVGIGGGATVTSMGNNLIEDNTSPGASITVVAPL